MNDMKSYTDIDQSRKLADILPFESADMHYVLIDTDKNKYSEGLGKYIGILPHYPCWSLAALMRLIPNFNMFKRTIECRIETTNHLIDKACDPIDATFEMVCWLLENGKI